MSLKCAYALKDCVGAGSVYYIGIDQPILFCKLSTLGLCLVIEIPPDTITHFMYALDISFIVIVE